MQISTDALMEHAAAVASLHGVDPRNLTGDDAAAWVSALARVRTSTEALMAVLAHRIDELSNSAISHDRFARAKGFAGAPTLVAKAGQMSSGDATRLVNIGKAMASADVGRGAEGMCVGTVMDSDVPSAQPTVLYEALARGLSAGVLAAPSADMIRSLLESLTEPTIELEVSLVRFARDATIQELRGRCDRELARDNAALVARERRQRRKRYIAFFKDTDGMVGLSGRLDPVTAAPIVSWVDSQVRAQLAAERNVDESARRNEGQIRADVFSTMALHALGCEDPAFGTKTVMVVQVDRASIETGVGVAVCHGLSGPISVAALRQLAVDAAVMPAVMGGSSLPLDLGRARRLYTPAQRIAIALRDEGCAKCGAPVNRCDVHHLTFWSDDGQTDIANGLLLCVPCHHRLHDYGWGVEIEANEVWFVPPESTDPERKRQPACATRSGP
jgi:hypothetical protein